MQSGKCSVLSVVLVFVLFFLVAMALFPVFFDRGHPAYKAKCLNNLKQCAQALKMYADDYNGQMPSSYFVRHSKQWNKRDSLYFCTRRGKTPSSLDSPRRTWAEALYYHMKSPDIVFCPKDPVDTTSANPRTSYWYKLANDKAWYGIGCEAPRRSMRDYGYESDQIAFYEHCGWHFGDNSGRLTNGLQINVSYIDTHVETIVIKSATSGDPINCSANSNGEPMYYNTAVDAKTYQPKQDKGPAHHTDPTTCYDSF